MVRKILITGGNGNIANIIKNEFMFEYEIYSPSRTELDVSNFESISNYLSTNEYDVLIHTAIKGGRRTKLETSDDVYINLLMFENIIKFSDRFKMIINLDSGATYDRFSNVMNRKEDDVNKVPSDYYGFSKYIIHKRTLEYENVYNFRIFNIFHHNEENDRFIKLCFNAKNNGTELKIFEDKYFDFFYCEDFNKILKYYIDNVNSNKLEKTINISYLKKYKLSEIAKIIENIGEYKKMNIIIGNEISDTTNNYCGDGCKLSLYNINFCGLETSLEMYYKQLRLIL